MSQVSKLNKQQAEKYRDIQLKYKYNLLHLLPSMETPELSGVYLRSFYNSVKRYQVTLPSSINDPDTKFCGRCGAVRVPGFNLVIEQREQNEAIRDGNGGTSSISDSNSNNNNGNFVDSDAGKGTPQRDVLVYTCLHCNHKAYFPLDSPKRSSSSQVATGAANTGDNKKSETISYGDGKKRPKNSSKLRAKKRKLNTLSSILANKKKEREGSPLASLTLESLMKG